MLVNGLDIQHSSEWEDYLEMNAQINGMTREEYAAYYLNTQWQMQCMESIVNLYERKKVTRKQLDKALGEITKITQDLKSTVLLWKDAKENGNGAKEAEHLDTLKKLNADKKAAEEKVEDFIKSLDKNVELQITEQAQEFGLVEGFTSKLNQIRQKAKNAGDFIKKTLADSEFSMFNGNDKFRVFLGDFYQVATESVNEATEVTKEMWDKEWNIKKAFGKDFERAYGLRVQAAMSKAKDEEQAEEWAYKNFKQLPNPAKGMTIEESVVTEGKDYTDYGLSDKFSKALDDLDSKKFNTKDITKLAKKHKQDPEKAIEYASTAFEWLWKESVMNESSELADRAAELDDIFQNSRNRRAIKNWEEYTEDLFAEYSGDQDGGRVDVYWEDIPEDELQTAIDVGQDMMNTYKIKESVVNEAKGAPWPEQLEKGLTHWGYKKGSHAREHKTLSCRIGRNADDYGGPNHAQAVADLNMKDPMVKKFFKPKFKVKPDGNYVNDHVELIPKKGYLYSLHVGTGQFEYFCLAIKPGEVYIFRKFDQAYGQYEYFQHEEDMSTRSGIFDFKRHREEEQWKWNKLKPDSASHFVSVGWGIMDIGIEYTQLEFQFENLKTFENFKLNEKAPFPYNLGYNGRNDHFKYAKEIGMAVKDIEGIRDYHKMAERGGKTAVQDLSSRILITTYGQPEIKDAIVKALKGVDDNLDLKTIKSNYDASDSSRSKHEQDNDMWKWEIQKKEDFHSYERKYGGKPKKDKEFTRDHQMEFIDMLAPYSTTQHELADIDITSLDSFLQYAADHVSAANLKKVTKRIRKEYPKLENNNTDDMKNLLTLESFLNERRSNYSGDDEKIIGAIRDAAKEGFIVFSSGREMDGSTVEISVDFNNKNLPKGQFSLMPMDGGDYFKVGKLKKAAPKAIARMNDELEEADSEYAVKMVGLEKREVIVRVVKKKEAKDDEDTEGSWWDNYSDEAKEKYIKKHGSAPDVGNKK